MSVGKSIINHLTITKDVNQAYINYAGVSIICISTSLIQKEKIYFKITTFWLRKNILLTKNKKNDKEKTLRGLKAGGV